MAILVCMCLSFCFSGIEAGLFSLNRLRIRHLSRMGDKRAALLNQYLEKPEDFLWTILAGNTMANFFAVVLACTGLYCWVSGSGALFWGLFALYVFLLYLLCDLLPKNLFQRNPNRLCILLAKPFRVFHSGLSPMVSLITWVSAAAIKWTGGKRFTGRLFGNREELRLMMQETKGDLTSEEQQMISRVLDFQSNTLRQIMVPMERVVKVNNNTPTSEAMKLCREKGFTRLPVEKQVEGKSRILGILSLKNVLYQKDPDLEKPSEFYVSPALYLSEGLNIEQALKRLQNNGQKLCIVLGKKREEIGIASLEDILKAIFGEVRL